MLLRSGGRRLRADLDDFDGGAAEVRLPAGISVQWDLSYGRHPLQRLDVYKRDNAANAPVIFMVHGGAWMAGDKAGFRVVQNKVAHWVPKGYLFVSINYRLLPDADPLEQSDDVAAALAFVQQNAGGWGGDASRLFVIGHSSGAHLLALLASDRSLAPACGVKPWLGAILLDSASMNVVSTMNAPHRPFYDRVFGRDPEYWRSVSPFHRLSGRVAAPMMMVCSALREDSCPQAQGYAEKIRSMGGTVNLFPVRLAHAEINAALGEAGPYTVAVDSFIRSVDRQEWIA